MIFFGEAREKTGGGNTARFASGDIGDVGKITFELFVVFIPEWHFPGAVTTGFARIEQVMHQWGVVAHNGTGVLTKGDDAGTGECSNVDDDIGLEAFTVGEGIAQDKPAFGVGV